jgi:hypothetical protein
LNDSTKYVHCCQVSFVLISWLVLSSQLRYNRFFLFEKVVKMADVDRGPTVIVDPAEILPVNDIRQKNLTIKISALPQYENVSIGLPEEI